MIKFKKIVNGDGKRGKKAKRQALKCQRFCVGYSAQNFLKLSS